MKKNVKNFSQDQFSNYSFSNLKVILGGTSNPDDDTEKGTIKPPTNGNSGNEDEVVTDGN